MERWLCEQVCGSPSCVHHSQRRICHHLTYHYTRNPRLKAQAKFKRYLKRQPRNRAGKAQKRGGRSTNTHPDTKSSRRLIHRQRRKNRAKHFSSTRYLIVKKILHKHLQPQQGVQDTHLRRNSPSEAKSKSKHVRASAQIVVL